MNTKEFNTKVDELNEKLREVKKLAKELIVEAGDKKREALELYNNNIEVGKNWMLVDYYNEIETSLLGASNVNMIG